MEFKVNLLEDGLVRIKNTSGALLDQKFSINKAASFNIPKDKIYELRAADDLFPSVYFVTEDEEEILIGHINVASDIPNKDALFDGPSQIKPLGITINLGSYRGKSGSGGYQDYSRIRDKQENINYINNVYLDFATFFDISYYPHSKVEVWEYEFYSTTPRRKRREDLDFTLDRTGHVMVSSIFSYILERTPHSSSQLFNKVCGWAGIEIKISHPEDPTKYEVHNLCDSKSTIALRGVAKDVNCATGYISTLKVMGDQQMASFVRLETRKKEGPKDALNRPTYRDENLNDLMSYFIWS